MHTAIKDFDFQVVTVNAKGEKVNQEQGQAKYFTEHLGNGVTLEMVAIPSGKFMMGAPKEEKSSRDDERPQRQVTVQPFFIGRFQVTQSQWKAISKRSASRRANLAKVESDLNPDPSRFKGDNRPVEKVSWDDAVEFCKRLSRETGREYRLPSEAEWEYACRAGTTTPFHFGETITTDLANYDGNYTYASEPKGEKRGSTTDVGIFPPNAFGLYDMHGNLWEWCADHWHKNYEGAPTDGSAWLSDNENQFRLLRGGSWDDCPSFCRSAYRYYYYRVNRIVNIGFRVVCSRPRT